METKKFKLENGVQIVTIAKSAPSVHFCLTINVGHNNESKETLGISSLLEKLILKRAQGKVQAIYGGTITSYFVEVPKEKWQEGLQTLLAVLNDFNFSEDNIAAEKEDIIKHTVDMFPIPRRQLKLLYKHTAYANADINWDMDNYIRSVGRYTAADIQAFAGRYYVAENTILVICGEIDNALLVQEVDKLLKGLPRGKQNPVKKDIYTGGFAQIPGKKSSLAYFGFDISHVPNIAELAVLLKLLAGRLERSFIDTDVNSDVKIAGYYGRRSLLISVESQQDNFPELLDIVADNIRRIRHEAANQRRMETSLNLAMVDYVEIFGNNSSEKSCREVAWQFIGCQNMFDVPGTIQDIANVSARDIMDAAENIFTTPMTLVVSSNQPVDYERYNQRLK